MDRKWRGRLTVYTFPEGGQGHGLGCGDIAGHGRMDIVLCKGWLEAPADPEKGQWILHEDFATPPWGWCASIPMLVLDINGDGQCELVTGKGCGIYFAVADLNRDGRPEIIAPGKEGLYVFFNEGAA